jgi:hypothetical protein
MATNGNKNKQKNSAEYYCKICDYITDRKCNYDAHILTCKHILATDGNKNQLKTSYKFVCEYCNKIYKDRTGLWKHKNSKNSNSKCINTKYTNNEESDEEFVNDPTSSDKDLILLLIKENSELKNMMMKVIENGTHNTTNNTTHTNSHNKAFNLNFFLNETCKDAMNIMDFVESIQFQLSDLERVGEKGYIEGISDIIIKNLKNLDVTQRPVHCTDKKRETIYVKDEDKWEKDDENIKMHKMVRKVQDKNFRMIKKFKEKYPDYSKASSKQSDVYNNIIIESMGGRGDNDYEKEEKIIKKVSKEVTIEK